MATIEHGAQGERRVVTDAELLSIYQDAGTTQCEQAQDAGRMNIVESAILRDRIHRGIAPVGSDHAFQPNLGRGVNVLACKVCRMVGVYDSAKDEFRHA